MSVSPDAAIRQWFQEVWNERREDAIDRFMTPDTKVHGMGPDPVVGPPAFKESHRIFCGAFADLKTEVLQTIVEGDRVAALVRVTGRHTGDALGGAATGKSVDFLGTAIGIIHDGRIVEGWNTFDFLTMYQQIGWVPAPVVG